MISIEIFRKKKHATAKINQLTRENAEKIRIEGRNTCIYEAKDEKIRKLSTLLVNLCLFLVS